jgi:hypothetical protein
MNAGDFMDSQKEILIDRLKSAREHLNQLVAQAPADKFIYPNWTLKQYLDHLSGWDDAIIASLNAHAKNEPVPLTAARGINAYNADTVTTREALSLEHTRREFIRSREAVIETIQNLADEKFDQPFTFAWGDTGTVADLVDIFASHDDEHAEHLTEWLKDPDQPIVGQH